MKARRPPKGGLPYRRRRPAWNQGGAGDSGCGLLALIGVLVAAVSMCSPEESRQAEDAAFERSREEPYQIPTEPAPEVGADKPEQGSVTSDASTSETSDEPQTNPAPITPLPDVIPEPAYTCGAKRYCTQMNSCEEATYHYEQCGLSRLDGDSDGMPCENVCG